MIPTTQQRCFCFCFSFFSQQKKLKATEFHPAVRNIADLKQYHKSSEDFIIVLTPNLFLVFYHTFTGSKQFPHLFIWCRLLSAEISTMNIHLSTSGEPQANQMSIPVRMFSHLLGCFILKWGQTLHGHGSIIAHHFKRLPNALPMTAVDVKRLYQQDRVFGRKLHTIHIYAVLNNPLSSITICTCVVNGFQSCTLKLYGWSACKIWYNTSLWGRLLVDQTLHLLLVAQWTCNVTRQTFSS